MVDLPGPEEHPFLLRHLIAQKGGEVPARVVEVHQLVLEELALGSCVDWRRVPGRKAAWLRRYVSR